MIRSHGAGVATAVLAAITQLALAQPDWQPTRGPGGGDIRALALAGDLAVASTTAGVHSSTDGGHTWQGSFRSPTSPAAGFGFVGATPSALFAQNTALEFFISTDGLTWTQASPPLNGVAVHRIAFGDGRTYAQLDPAVGAPFHFSDDHGQTWAPLPGSPSGPDGLIVHGQEVFSSTLELRDFGFTRIVTAFQSTDRGTSFTVIGGSDAQINGIPPEQAGTPQRVGNKLVCGRFVSDDNGQSWRFFDMHQSLRDQFCGPDFCEFRLPSSAMLGDGLYVHTYLDFMDQDEPADNFFLWKTSDFLTWTQVPASAALPDLLVWQSFWRENDGSIFIAGTLGLFRSDDGGVSWAQSNQGINASIIWDLEAVDGALVANTVNTNEVSRTAGPSSPWSDHTIFDNGAFFGTVLRLFSPDGGTLLAGHLIDGITRSDDAGLTWEFSRAGVPQYNGTAGLQYAEVEAFTQHGSVLLAGTGEGMEHRSDGGQGFVHVGRGMLRSFDEGRTWTRSTSGLRVIGHNSFFEPQYDPIFSMTSVGNTVVAGGMFLGVVRSTNSGASWSSSNTGLPMLNATVAASDVTALTTIDGVVYLGLNGVDQDAFPGVGSVFRSTDQGVTWTPASTGLPQGAPVAAIAAYDGAIYAGLAVRNFVLQPFQFSDLGVYRSTDGGLSWQPAGAALVGVGVRALEVFNNTLFAGTDHLGVWALTTACGSADFDNDGDTATDADIEAFFACLAGNCCPACGSADFNGDGDAATDADIEAFFRVLAGGSC